MEQSLLPDRRNRERRDRTGLALCFSCGSLSAVFFLTFFLVFMTRSLPTHMTTTTVTTTTVTTATETTTAATETTTPTPLPCPPPPLIYTFDQNPCGNSCGKCITFLNSSLYYLAGSNSAHYIYPFAAVNSTTVAIGANIVQPNQTLGPVYGCGRKNDATFYVSSDSFALSEINTTSQVDTGSATISRGFALVNYTQLFKLNIVDANEVTGVLDASDNIVANLTMVGTCAPLKGYGMSWDPVTHETFLIYSFLSGQNQNTRFIGHVDLTTGVVTPTCVQNVNRSFNSMTFDDQGEMWVLVGNAPPDNNKVFRFDNAPPLQPPFIDTPLTPCNHSGQEILGEGSEFGRALEMSGDGSTIIVGARKAPFSYAKVYRRIDACCRDTECIYKVCNTCFNKYRTGWENPQLFEAKRKV